MKNNIKLKIICLILIILISVTNILCKHINSKYKRGFEKASKKIIMFKIYGSRIDYIFNYYEKKFIRKDWRLVYLFDSSYTGRVLHFVIERRDAKKRAYIIAINKGKYIEITIYIYENIYDF
jgi:hypothetical protein